MVGPSPGHSVARARRDPTTPRAVAVARLPGSGLIRGANPVSWISGRRHRLITIVPVALFVGAGAVLDLLPWMLLAAAAFVAGSWLSGRRSARQSSRVPHAPAPTVDAKPSPPARVAKPANESSPATLIAARERVLREHSADPILVLSLRGTILWGNPATELLTGYATRELAGRQLAALIANVNVGLLDDGLGNGREVWIVHRNGGRVRCRLRMVPVTAGRDRGIVAFLREAGTASETSSAEDEDAAGKGADPRLMDEFGYVVAHDLSEPAQKIQGFTRLLKKRYGGQLGEDGTDYLDYILEATARLRELIEALLRVSRVARDGKPFESVDTGQIVDVVIARMATELSEAGSQVEVTTELPRVQGDPAQLAELFGQLIQNAIKFHGVEQPRVEISAERHGHSWEFQITDNGIGFDARYNDRVFGVFERLHPPGEYPGAGVGLAICKRIVERHGGDLWVESAPAIGSTFHFTIPDREDARRSLAGPEAQAA